MSESEAIKHHLLRCAAELPGQRATAVMSLIQSAKLCGHDPYAYVRDGLIRLPTQKNRDIANLRPHHWSSSGL